MIDTIYQERMGRPPPLEVPPGPPANGQQVPNKFRPRQRKPYDGPKYKGTRRNNMYVSVESLRPKI